MSEVLEKFGEILMRRVRDKAISDWKMIMSGKMKGERAAQLRRLIESFSIEQQQVLLRLVPEVVDTVLHHLLWTLDQSTEITVAVSADKEATASIRDVSDGLAGELYSVDGWIARFSEEKV